MYCILAWKYTCEHDEDISLPGRMLDSMMWMHPCQTDAEIIDVDIFLPYSVLVYMMWIYPSQTVYLCILFGYTESRKD
jgi:hypothetical protein